MHAKFRCEKQPATGSRGMAVANHPLASGVAAGVLLEGGNAIDAAIAALFALTVVEPMMVGVLGGGLAHIRLADGRHTIIDGMSTAPAAARPGMFHPAALARRDNQAGPRAVATPGALAAWCATLKRYGTMSLADVVEPAIRLAERGFVVTPYLSDCIVDTAADLVRDPVLAARFMPGGTPLPPGARLLQGDYAHTLRLIGRMSSGALHGGPLGSAVCNHLAAAGGHLTVADLTGYQVVECMPLRGSYRGFDILGPPPPSSGGVAVIQMLAILEGYDLAGLGSGSAGFAHLVAEALKIAFADRAAGVPADRRVSHSHAAAFRARIKLTQTQDWATALPLREGSDTTHVTVADAWGNVVASTQTLNGLFGSCVGIPGTGLIANNYMVNFDPVPGRALSIAPGKRVFSSMAPMMALRDGRMAYALGLPGGLRIFGSAMQALLNLVDHGMDLQHAVEAPRIWTQGGALELEPGIGVVVAGDLASRGHAVQWVRRVGGGMSAIGWDAAGIMTGAACWRADGVPVGIAGGLAQAGVRFST